MGKTRIAMLAVAWKVIMKKTFVLLLLSLTQLQASEKKTDLENSNSVSRPDSPTTVKRKEAIKKLPNFIRTLNFAQNNKLVADRFAKGLEKDILKMADPMIEFNASMKHHLGSLLDDKDAAEALQLQEDYLACTNSDEFNVEEGIKKMTLMRTKLGTAPMWVTTHPVRKALNKVDPKSIETFKHLDNVHLDSIESGFEYGQQRAEEIANQLADEAAKGAAQDFAEKYTADITRQLTQILQEATLNNARKS